MSRHIFYSKVDHNGAIVWAEIAYGLDHACGYFI
jgi:hypothetical protein